jgi:hypothetical protein
MRVRKRFRLSVARWKRVARKDERLLEKRLIAYEAAVLGMPRKLWRHG